MKRILVAGGTGYIGSHVCVELLKEDFEIIVADNFYNSSPVVLDRIRELTGKDFTFHELDLTDIQAVDTLFATEKIDSIIVLAGYKAVGESVEIPLAYYRNNLDIVFTLSEAAVKHAVSSIVFSSSATVYGEPQWLPLTEDHPVAAYSPYGFTKLYTEQILRDINTAHQDISVAALRYFNPIGAHASGRIGEAPDGCPNNLMPYITQVAIGKREKLMVFGEDYNTPDGTGVRDFIHVVDLAKGHVAALRMLEKTPGYHVHNLATGQGYSVLELIKKFEEINNIKIPYTITDRRQGDIAECWADPSKSKRDFGWEATKTLEDMVRDSWNWQKTNPNGYSE